MEPPKPTLLLPNAALTKAKEAGHRAVRITDLKISDGTSTNRSARLIGTKMAEAGLRIEDGHSVIGPGLAGSRDRSATMIAVVAVEEAVDRQVKQAADMQPTSLKANFMLEDFGGFSFQQGGASYSTIEFLPFDGDHYKEVAHIRGVNLLSAAHTSARLEYINNNIIVPSVQATPRFLHHLFAKMPTSIQQVERHYFRFPGPFFAEQLSVASCLP